MWNIVFSTKFSELTYWKLIVNRSENLYIDLGCEFINPSTPESDYQITSPKSITPASHIKVMRIKEMITNYTSS